MIGKYHVIASGFLYVALAILRGIFHPVDAVMVTVCASLILWGYFPDLDQFIHKHRHWFMHSNILPFTLYLIFYFTWAKEFFSTMCAIVALHLTMDFKSHGTDGTYRIIARGHRWSVWSSDWWLALNGFFPLAICLITTVI
jgi:hypothetical protein